MDCRPYDPAADREALWRLKAAFERGLADGTGDDAKRAAYEAKLTDAYRERYLDWVDRCVDESVHCVMVAVDRPAGRSRTDREAAPTGPPADGHLAGYAFVLPESLALVWDAAVLNELYVVPDRRGTGVADDLLAAALEAARGQDLPLDRLVLDVDPANGRARAFYARHGFEPWGELVARPL